jgi:excisionase family DNA binding protein
MTRLLTVEEVATILGVGKEKASMLMHWAIGHYRIGGKRLVSTCDVIKFLNLIDRSDLAESISTRDRENHLELCL